MASDSAQQLPRRLMGDVYWPFSGEPFASQAEFDAAIRAYHLKNWGESSWQPDRVAVPAPRLAVRPDLSSFPRAEEPAAVELTADDGVAFTAGELLRKAHNTFVAVLRSRDAKYFEGFRLVGAPEERATPLYEIQLGS